MAPTCLFRRFVNALQSRELTVIRYQRHSWWTRVLNTRPGSSLTSSMYRDLKEQAPVEVDSILGDLIEQGRKHAVSAPIVQAAFVSLTIYRQGRARAKAARDTMSSASAHRARQRLRSSGLTYTCDHPSTTTARTKNITFAYEIGPQTGRESPNAPSPDGPAKPGRLHSLRCRRR
jgi:hypothetical protein